MPISKSKLVAYTRLSPNNSGTRTKPIDRITPHCVDNQLSAKRLGAWFAKESTQASSNYGIDCFGRIAMFVDENNCSWCSSNSENDQRAVTIECSSDNTEPYAFHFWVYWQLIRLCVDICRRNGKKKLIWLEDKETALAYSPRSDEMLLTVHRWFSDKTCPGDWLYSRMDDLARKVTARLNN